MDPCAREAALAATLDVVVAGRGPVTPVSGDPAWAGSLAVLDLVLALRWDDGLALACSLSPVDPADREATWLRRGVTAWAAAGDLAAGSDAFLAGLLDDLPDVGHALGRFAGHVLVEAAMAHARLDLAAQLADRLAEPLWGPLILGGVEHPFGLMAQACRVRLLAFRGELALADAVLRAVPVAPDGPIAAVLAATTCLVRGNTADPSDVRRLVALVDEHTPDVGGLLGAGAQMLASYGLIAIGDVTGAARRVLLAGGESDLGHLDVIDRALGLEMLVVLALAAHDLDAAQTWADRVRPLASSPIADSTTARVMSRVALAEGRVADAVAWGERAVARAREVDRVIEYAEGEIVLGRARLLQRGEGGRAAAVRALEAMVEEAERHGHRAVRRSAARELRPIGLRLRPLAGSGWTGLSAREAEVARYVGDGETNREIALRLHVSEHTVRAHVSRVLAAFGVATRAALPGVMGVQGQDRTAYGGGALAPLTPRQREVAGLIGRGMSNRAIGAELGLSLRTVEKHVGDILVRWDLPGRTSIAREVNRAGPVAPLM